MAGREGGGEGGIHLESISAEEGRMGARSVISSQGQIRADQDRVGQDRR